MSEVAWSLIYGSAYILGLKKHLTTTYSVCQGKKPLTGCPAGGAVPGTRRAVQENGSENNK
jgi:hypothetical protein